MHCLALVLIEDVALSRICEWIINVVLKHISRGIKSHMLVDNKCCIETYLMWYLFVVVVVTVFFFVEEGGSTF